MVEFAALSLCSKKSKCMPTLSCNSPSGGGGENYIPPPFFFINSQPFTSKPTYPFTFPYLPLVAHLNQVTRIPERKLEELFRLQGGGEQKNILLLVTSSSWRLVSLLPPFIIVNTPSVNSMLHSLWERGGQWFLKCEVSWGWNFEPLNLSWEQPCSLVASSTLSSLHTQELITDT